MVLLRKELLGEALVPDTFPSSVTCPGGTRDGGDGGHEEERERRSVRQESVVRSRAATNNYFNNRIKNKKAYISNPLFKTDSMD